MKIKLENMKSAPLGTPFTLEGKEVGKVTEQDKWGNTEITVYPEYEDEVHQYLTNLTLSQRGIKLN